jgi:hypothetical protein
VGVADIPVGGLAKDCERLLNGKNLKPLNFEYLSIDSTPSVRNLKMTLLLTLF